MPEDPSLPKTETLIAGSSSTSRSASISRSASTSSRYTKTRFGKQNQGFSRVGHVFVGVWAIIAALATIAQPVQTRFLERYAQSAFFNLRGPVAPPKDVVILAIDEYSLNPTPSGFDQRKPSPLQLSWPIRRAIHAEVIDRLMQAGAKTVAVDVLFANPSTFGEADDRKLQATLQKYAKRVVLAASYDDSNVRQGSLNQFISPFSWVENPPKLIGTINFWAEPDNFWQEPSAKEGIIHRLGSQFPLLMAKTYPNQADYFNNISAQVPSFAPLALKAAQVKVSPPKGDNIFFYGPGGSFDQISFRDVLDPENWNTYLDKGKYFKDKIVVIGGTAVSLQDFHSTPFGTVAGVEIHASAIATLLENKAIAEVFPNVLSQGAFVFLLVATAGVFQGAVLTILGSRQFQKHLQQSLIRFVLAAGIVRFLIAAVTALAWGGVGFVAFTYGQMILPVAVPMGAIVLSGVTYLVTASASEYRSKLQLLRILAQFPRSEVVQRILSEYVEFQELLQEPEGALTGQLLGNRYMIKKVLGAGGFGKTYIAEDTQRPGNPVCVVKQLKPASDNPNLLQLAHKLFRREAKTLEDLGSHDRIPQLLAYFEEDEEFYLVQEYISGQPLSYELSLGRRMPAANVVAMVQEILQILEFVHSQGVIHRDIKPSNIIRRALDKRLVLIDFGAVKVSEQAETEDQSALTIGIGTKGYMPNEQSGGKPRPNSDIYAVGMIGIQALTGLFPNQLREKENPRTGKIDWEEDAERNKSLEKILNRMVHYDFQKRYQTARSVLNDLKPLAEKLPPMQGFDPAISSSIDNTDSAYAEGETKHWPEALHPNAPPPNDH